MPLSQEQVANRYKTLGASDVARVFDGRALDVYCEKVQLTPPFEGNEQTEWGNRLEEKVAEKYAEVNGVTLREGSQVTAPGLAWATCTPDRFVAGKDGEQYLLEIKTTGVRHEHDWGETGTDEVPTRVAVQCAWQMFVTGDSRCDVAVLIGGQAYRQYTLRRDAEIEQALVAQMTDFWEQHVAKREPPPLDGSESAHKLLAALWPDAGTAMLPADEEMESLLLSLQDIKGRIKGDEALESEVEVRLKALIGENAGIVSALNGLKATWTKNKTGAVSWKKVADELNPPADLVARYTGEPPRVFRFTAKGA